MSIFDVDDIQTAIAPLLRDFYGLDADEAQGDARLLAEAAAARLSPTPYLFEAAKKAKVLIGAINDSLSPAQRESNYGQAWHLLDAAIARAEGELA